MKQNKKNQEQNESHYCVIKYTEWKAFLITCFVIVTRQITFGLLHCTATCGKVEQSAKEQHQFSSQNKAGCAMRIG